MPSRTALIWAGAASVAVAAVGAAALYRTYPERLQPSPAPVATIEPTQSQPPPSAPGSVATGAVPSPSAVRPTFDVVQVEPGGEAVVAGRAAPNVKVTLLDGGRTLAQATADARGEFVMIPGPLSPGDHTLTLSTGAGGPTETSPAVPVSVARPPDAAQSSSPATSSAAAIAGGAGSRVAVRSVDASGDGGLVARGSAEPNAIVRLYVNGAYVGDARTGDDGGWSLTIERGMTPGAYALRADVIDPKSAGVVQRVEAPFTIPALAALEKSAAARRPPEPSSRAEVVIDAVQTHHVNHGETLWGISQRVYGDGSRYAIIFSANSKQIRDPNLIYPGQTFVVPKGEPKP